MTRGFNLRAANSRRAAKVRWLLVLALALSAANPIQAQRQTVFVLVDESGSLKSDRAGWRKQAASLLAYSLSDGSSMSLSGFGDVGRRLALTPIPLDSTPSGNQRRESLARTAVSLGDSDRRTDLFGAIREVLVEASKMDPSLRKSAPPVLIVLSDFRPDPVPDFAAQRGFCEEIQRSRVDLIEVGFGALDRKTSDYLAACAGTSLWGAVSDPAALPEVFWKLQNRFTRSLKIFEQVPRTRDVRIPIPDWADELLVLGLSERSTDTTSDWSWSGKDLMQVQQGERFRLARIGIKQGAQRQAETAIQLSKTESVKLIAVARGPLVLTVSTKPTGPWVRSENVSTTARLTASRSGRVVTEWAAVPGAQYSSVLTNAGGIPTSLLFDPESNLFNGTMVVPSEPQLTAEASVSIDGANWLAHFGGAVVPLPVDAALDSQGRLMARAWTRSEFVEHKLRSALPNREFDITLEPTGPIEVNQKLFTFNASVTDVSFGVRAKGEPRLADFLSNWFEDHPPQVGFITVTARLQTGQIITFTPPIPVVWELRPLWSRVAIAIALISGAFGALFVILRGRRLPPWLLVSSDIAGKPIRGADPIRLRAYHRSMDLTRYGMPGAVIYKSLGGKVGVRLRGNVRLRVAGSARPQDLHDGSGDSLIGIGDSLHCPKSDGAELIYKVDAF
jgi:hypothetical protein